MDDKERRVDSAEPEPRRTGEQLSLEIDAPWALALPHGAMRETVGDRCDDAALGMHEKGTSVNLDQRPLMSSEAAVPAPLQINAVHEGDAAELMSSIEPETVALSVWSPPYFVGKSYESHLTFEDWAGLLEKVIKGHFAALKPGGFMAINIADILAFPDHTLPRFQANVLSTKRSPVTREMVIEAKAQHPQYNRYQLAELLGCSEQTIQRRLDHNNVRGGKYATQTRVKIVGGLIEQFGEDAGLVMYDRRVWVKDPAWANSRWHSLSYRAVDEFEYVYIFWKPGITEVDRGRLTRAEWREWGSRGVWEFPSVRANDDHEAKFPKELPLRLIKLFTRPGEIVLDPFMGSGTTGVAAVELGRAYLGFELLPHYAALARTSISRATQRTGESVDEPSGPPGVRGRP